MRYTNYPETCGRGLSNTLFVYLSMKHRATGIQENCLSFYKASKCCNSKKNHDVKKALSGITVNELFPSIYSIERIKQ